MNAKHGTEEDLKLIFACSGASDVGHLADLAARAVARDGPGRMYCLAGIAGGVEDMQAKTRSATRLVVLDGCEQECARKTRAKAGFSGFGHLKLTELGFAKGESSATPERVRLVVQETVELLKKP
jgi:uncharacterized metal-binding protein